jgi:dUTP pyrophosphatase
MTNLPKIKIKKLFENAVVPTRVHPTDSGLDLTIYKFEKLFQSGDSVESELPGEFDNLLLLSGARVLVNTGISATVGSGFEIQIRPRSGLALKDGLTVLNTPGTVDEAYRGFLGVIIINLFGCAKILKIGMKIAQMVVCPVILSEVLVVSELDDTARNAGGFGSTGV